MNVGIMVSSQAPQAGGGFTFEDDILQAFFRRRAESPHHYFIVGNAPSRPASLDATGLPWLSLHRARAVRRTQKAARWAAAVARKLKLGKRGEAALDYEAYPDLKKQPLDLICYLTPLVRPIADIPYLTTVWDLAHRVVPFFPEVGLRGEWEERERRYREVLSRAVCILTLNARGRQELIEWYGVEAERIRALTLPTPSFALSEGTKPRGERPSLERLGIIGEYLFYPAQFWAHKNHACLILALEILRDRHNYRPQLVLTGSDKGNRAHVEKMARERALESQVVFTGFVSREDLAALYRHAAALVYPSFFGPENLPPLEAMALGCPAIVSALAGHEIQLGDAALLADPTRPEAWADAIRTLRQSGARRDALIERGLARARRYTPDDYAGDLLKIIDEFAPYRRCWPSGG